MYGNKNEITMIRREKMNKTIKVYDKTTGEEREVELYKIFSITSENPEQFYQQYANGVMALMGIKPYFCACVFMYMCIHSNNGQFYMNQKTRDKIKECSGLSVSSITKALLILNNYGVIERVCRGEYKINPTYGWYGTTLDRMKLLKDARVSIRFDIRPNEEVLDQEGLRLIESEVKDEFRNART